MSTGGGMGSPSWPQAIGADGPESRRGGERCGYFQMPLHYPRYTKDDYECMPEWKLDRLLDQYGLPVVGDVKQKRSFAMGAFLWP
ncbi:hypothetical protein Syun_026156 [Stephania yunnanensis]|uniref:DUF7722 domain-containing protein n=1 Tax=Stephania yunnanensis TaxID=152371 RepID=A0AAP0ESZ4_9MAGN